MTIKNIVENLKSWTFGLAGIHYRVATLATLYLTIIDIVMSNLKLIGQF